MPAHEQKETSVEILNNWESVGLSDEGTFKYVLIEAYASEKLEGTNILSSLIMIVNLKLISFLLFNRNFFNMFKATAQKKKK